MYVMNQDVIFGLNRKIYELEHELLQLAKKSTLTDEETKRMMNVKQEIAKLENEVDEYKKVEQNWSCSYSCESVNGKVEKTFMVNNKKVSENEYRQFFKKVSSISRPGSLFSIFFNEFDRVLSDCLFSDLLLS